jgi:hypothetical protein
MAGTIVTTIRKAPKPKRGATRVNVALTCVSGAISAQPIGKFYGKLVGIYLEPTAGAGATMTSTADVLITDATTGASLIADLDFGTARYEKVTMPIQNSAGAVVTPGANDVDCRRDLVVAGTLNVAIANATTTDTGLLSLVFEE